MPQDWTPKTPASRPTRVRAARLSADEVRDRMLRQGVEVIRARGLMVGLDDVRMEDLIAAAEVPRSSVWRIWPGKWEYLVDVLAMAADPQGANLLRPPLDEPTLEIAVASAHERLDLLVTPEGRRVLLLETVRVALEHNYRVHSTSTSWRTYMALLSTVNAIADDDARRKIAVRLQAAERTGFIAVMARFYESLSAALGLRLRAPQYTFEHIALAGSALVEGLAIRNAILEADEVSAPGVERPTLDELLHGELPGPQGTGPWTTTALAFLGVVDAFLEPDPDFVVPPEALPAG
ncbi:hypothetical protein [Actinotalea sp.]|uniref:TetR/AcrR family transcriptional regulator n=1 Tax=Actinotalea sp. TaxID=1872145 RepID=UPI002D036643|nr:hypothetical protein [Actinotalea sp.]HRA51989.1 hypothetical protein [Actinotalea sp.]